MRPHAAKIAVHPRRRKARWVHSVHARDALSDSARRGGSTWLAADHDIPDANAAAVR
jgi:hypothetical protein